MPPPRVPHALHSPHAELANLIDSLQAAQHVLEMYRRNLSQTPARGSLDRLANRLVKILAAVKTSN
jgi:hypothetical protein